MGTIGKVHSDAFPATGEAEIAAICDIDEKKLSEHGKRLNVTNCFTDYHDLLKTDIQAVVVCVGNALHRDVAVLALKAGKHVLLEKPMAMNAAEAEEIAATAEKTGNVLQIAMVWRQNPAAKIVREYIENGDFGEIYHMRAVLIRRRGIPGLGGWFTTKAASGGGPMIDLGVHWFDLAMWLSNCWNPTGISAKTYARFGPKMRDYRYVGMWAGPPKFDGVFDVEDYSTGIVRFGSQATMSFEISWAANACEDTYVDIMGDKGGARVGDGKPLRIFTEHNKRPADIAPQFNADVDRYASQAKSFVSACRGDAPPAATGQEGVVVMKVLDGIYASSESDREIEI